MGKLSAATAGVIMAAAMLGASSARADMTLLSLVNPPGQTGTKYDLAFTATAKTTTISIGGYQTIAYEYVSGLSVTQGGGANLLSTTWTLTPGTLPGFGTDARIQPLDGNPRLWFGGFSAWDYDTFSQTFATTQGANYLLTFNFTNDSFAGVSALLNFAATATGSSALLVATNGLASAAPEPSTWAMALLGFAGLALVGYRRKRKARLLSCP